MERGNPNPTEAEADVINGVPVGHLVDTFGLGPVELGTQVRFGTYEGTLGEALTDERCPLGSMVASTYETDGFEGVEKQIGLLSQMSGGAFKLEISATTRAYHEGDIGRDDLLRNPTDFLA